MSRSSYLFPVPAKPLRSLLDAKAKGTDAFSEEEATLDLMLAIDRDDVRPLRYLAARWGWSKNRVHRGLPTLREQAGLWRSFYSPEAGQSVGQAGTDLGQAGTGIGVDDTPEAGSGTDLGQAGTSAGQYRTDPDTRSISHTPPVVPRAEPAGAGEKPLAKKPKAKPEPTYPACVTEGAVTPEAWDEWATYRTEKKKALTPTTVKRQSAQLIKYHDAGHDANATLAHAIEKGWVGFFEPKPGDAAHADTLADARGGGGTVGGQPQGGALTRGAATGRAGGSGGVRGTALQRASGINVRDMLEEFGIRDDDGNFSGVG